jgi:hypothetical protein
MQFLTENRNLIKVLHDEIAVCLAQNFEYCDHVLILLDDIEYIPERGKYIDFLREELEATYKTVIFICTANN